MGDDRYAPGERGASASALFGEAEWDPTPPTARPRRTPPRPDFAVRQQRVAGFVVHRSSGSGDVPAPAVVLTRDPH